MAERSKFVVDYSVQSLKNSIEIVAYLRRKFSEREVDQFYHYLADFEKIITLFPLLYAESTRLKIRRAVLSKELSIFYNVRKNTIYVVAILDNRWEEERRLK